MRKMKGFVMLCVVFALMAILTACAGEAEQTVDNPANDAFVSIEYVQNEPAAHIGRITLMGVVANSDIEAFALQNEAGTFEVLVNFRGSQELPQGGDIIAVEGLLTQRQNRSCCEPGYSFTMNSTRFELVEQ